MRCWQRVLSVAGAVVLTGCATSPTSLPSHATPPASECRWALSDEGGVAHVRRVVAALEAEGYSIRHTDTTLRVVSAERSRILPGYGVNFYEAWPRTGVFGSYGIGRGGRSSIGFGTSIGGGSYRFAPDATRVEQLSVVAPDGWVQVSADIRILDPDGVVRESRSATTASFCSALRQRIEQPREATSWDE
ncbi:MULTISPECIES: hypothetical protein [Halomonadaceae]|uniref:hypothetical protein n=1 Tax=Halomonadaceae TaxID=28256 RepID=UPI0015979CFA|nr:MULTISPECIES: hypothetical protein [Halomonas]QJQ94998.1 hypothetical protein HIO72_06765 [Halomonas sp. PA5]